METFCKGLDLDCAVQHEGFKALANKTVLLQVGKLLEEKEGRRYQRKKINRKQVSCYRV